MPIPKNKKELLQAISEDYSTLKKELNDVPQAFISEKTLKGHATGTLMSISNLVSYLIGWGELVIKWERKSKNGERIDFPETNYNWSKLGELAQKFYVDYEKYDYGELLIKLNQTVNTLNRMVEKYSNEDLYVKEWYKQYSFGRMIQLNSSSPYKNARIRIRKWKKINNIE